MQDVSAMSDDSSFLVNTRNNYRAVAGAYSSSSAVDKTSTTSSEQQRITFAEEVKKDGNFPFAALPIYDVFLDLHHPAEPRKSPDTEIWIGIPTEDKDDIEVQSDIRDLLPDISSLAFPDYDTSTAQEVGADGEISLEAHRYMKHQLETPGFQHFTFTLKLQSGSLVYAHVRRYLPPLKEAPYRYDVGRRLDRAMVIFSRYPGADDFYAAVLRYDRLFRGCFHSRSWYDLLNYLFQIVLLLLVNRFRRTLDGIASLHLAIHSNNIICPQKMFMQNLSKKHVRLSGYYATNFDDRRGAPHIITLQGLEFADSTEHYGTVDATHFVLPDHLLHAPLIADMKVSYNCSILPVMRCLGVVNSLRLLSALLCECRIVVVSVSPARLDRSIRAALSMLAQGMLNWPHLSIPVIPPDQWSYLSSPTPYIIGVLSPMVYRLELTNDLEDVVVFNLDENTVATMGNTKLSKLVPDVCRGLSEAMIAKRRIPLAENTATENHMASLSILNSSADILAQDLVEISKSDKQTMNGTAVAAKDMAKMASKAVKSTLQYLWSGGGDKNDDGEIETTETKKSNIEKRMESDFIFIEGCLNVAGEEAARLAFTSFFLRILGNSEGYVLEPEGPRYSLDKSAFLRERKERGDGPGTAMDEVMKKFVETKLAKDYVQTREEQIRKRQPTPIDAPLFWKCVNFLEIKDIDFGVINVRSVARMLLQKSSLQQMLPSNVRRLTMALTSKRKFMGNVEDAISDLAELSRESSSAMYDIMSVIWLRSRDCKGLQWVHGYQAMKLLREVLLHGPLSAITLATDGVQTVRTLAFRKSQGCEQIQPVALDIYNLLSDRSRLVLRRRAAAEVRRHYCDPEPTPVSFSTCWLPLIWVVLSLYTYTWTFPHFFFRWLETPD